MTTLGGARRGYVNQGYTAKDYVQDGLFIHFDGIENVGYGLHDDSSRSWVDLKGFAGCELYNDAHFAADCLMCDNQVDYATISHTSAYSTIELVFKPILLNYAVVSWIYNQSPFHIEGNPSKNIVTNGMRDGNTNALMIPVRLNDRVSVAFTKNGDLTVDAFKNGDRLFGLELYGVSWGIGDGSFNAINNLYGRGGKYHFCTLRAYSRILTTSEVAANYAVDKARFNLT